MANSNENIKVLIVDDSIIARMAIKKMIAERKYIIIEASNGAEALKLIDAEKPDLIFLDYLMPGINGLVTLQLLRGKGITTPVIVVSANQQERSKERFLELNIVAFLKKQLDKVEVLSLVDIALGVGGSN